MIRIRRNPTADTRTCDYTTVSKTELLRSSLQHIQDVRQALDFFADTLRGAALDHDADKIGDIDGFYAKFQTGVFDKGDWHLKHLQLTRHHLTYEEGIPMDVNLLDVLEYVADCVMAGLSRKGQVDPPPTLPPALLERALQNTVALLTQEVVVDGA